LVADTGLNSSPKTKGALFRAKKSAMKKQWRVFSVLLIILLFPAVGFGAGQKSYSTAQDSRLVGSP